MKKLYLPAEWQPQQAVILTFPDEETIWREALPEVEPCYVDFARAILAFEDLIIVCRTPAKENYIKRLLGDGPFAHRLSFFHTQYNDVWVRDYGPITLLQGDQRKWVDFKFNAWGNKYEGGVLDNQVTQQLFNKRLLQVDKYQREDFILEGGAIETDGLGTLLITDCVFTQTRNAELTRPQLENKLKQALQVDRIILIEHGYLLGDDTDGHVDTLVRFCDPHTLAYSSCDETEDPHYENLKKMHEQLKTLKDRNGEPYRLIPLPIPSAKFDDTDRRLPASYANFLIINGAVLCPTYDDENDGIVLERISRAFPDRQIIPIPSLPLVQFNGALHCASMQIPFSS